LESEEDTEVLSRRDDSVFEAMVDARRQLAACEERLVETRKTVSAEEFNGLSGKVQSLVEIVELQGQHLEKLSEQAQEHSSIVKAEIQRINNKLRQRAEEDSMPVLSRSRAIIRPLECQTEVGQEFVNLESIAGFDVNAVVEVGSNMAEERRVVGHAYGPTKDILLLDRALRHCHQPGEPVTLIRKGDGTLVDIDAQQHRVETGEFQRSSANVDGTINLLQAQMRHGGFEYRPPKIPPIPRDGSDPKLWYYRMIRSVELTSSRVDYSERTYLIKVLDITDSTDRWLDEVPTEMILLDRVLYPELQRIAEPHGMLKRSITVEEINCVAKGEFLTSVRILFRILVFLREERTLATPTQLPTGADNANPSVTTKGESETLTNTKPKDAVVVDPSVTTEEAGPSAKNRRNAGRRFGNKYCKFGLLCQYQEPEAGEYKCNKDHYRFPTQETWQQALRDILGNGIDGTLSPAKQFWSKFCRWGHQCKFAGVIGATRCNKDHTKYPDIAEWKIAYKGVTGASGSEDE
jgi:hypothetical protein